MSQTLKGSCCCGSVSFTVKDEFSRFYICYCQQCRQLTGSAHAANLFTSPANLTWLSGQDQLKRYDHPTRTFSKVFCSECGSALPFVNKSGEYLIVPAGCLLDAPSIAVQAQIFCDEQAPWHQAGVSAKRFVGFPEE